MLQASWTDVRGDGSMGRWGECTAVTCWLERLVAIFRERWSRVMFECDLCCIFFLAFSLSVQYGVVSFHVPTIPESTLSNE